MALLKNKKINIYVVAVAFLLGLVFLFFNDFGVLKYIDLQDQLDDLNEEITQVEEENRNIDSEIDSLQKKIPAKIEKVAREKYNMIREGETAVKVLDSASSSTMP